LIAQKWEYRTMVRAHRTTSKDREIRTDSPGIPKPPSWDVDIAQLLPVIGNEGWELGAISSRTSSFSVDGQSWLVTEEVWVFKRPKA
jgi:hypothetical protein